MKGIAMLAQFNPGDLVRFTAEANGLIRPEFLSQTYRVLRTLKTNASIQPVNGGRPVRAAMDLLEVVTDDKPAASVIGQPYLPALWCGTVVTVAGRGWKEAADIRWVVLSFNARDQYKIARLGGDEGRYYPSVPRQFLTEIKL